MSLGTTGRDLKRRENFWSNSVNTYGLPNQKFLKHVQEFYKPGMTAIDIASGDGRYAFELAKIGYKTTALEYTQSGVQRIMSYAKNIQIDLDVIQGDFTQENSDFGVYDVVLSSGLLEEIDKKYHHQVIHKYQLMTNKGGLCMIKRCIEIGGRGILVDEGWIESMFDTGNRDIIESREKQTLKISNAAFVTTGNNIDESIRTGTLIARNLD